jgi:hypothetical protein
MLATAAPPVLFLLGWYGVKKFPGFRRLMIEEDDPSPEDIEEEEEVFPLLPPPSFVADTEEAEQLAEAQAELEAREAEQDFRLRDVIEEVTGHVKFTRKKVLVGYEHLPSGEVSVHEREVPYPTGEFIIRPIRSPEEQVYLLEQEKCFPPAVRRARVFSGEALVRVPAERHVKMEDIHKPKYREELQVLYPLLDLSGSMHSQENPWRPPVWMGIVFRLLDKAMRHEVPFYMRGFGSEVSPLTKLNSTRDALHWRQARLREGFPDMGGTNTTKALVAVLNDFKKVEYDKGDVILVSDGEDEGLSWQDLRYMFDQANIKIHVIMLGQNNASLRKLAHSYQVVSEDLTVGGLILNG